MLRQYEILRKMKRDTRWASQQDPSYVTEYCTILAPLSPPTAFELCYLLGIFDMVHEFKNEFSGK